MNLGFCLDSEGFGALWCSLLPDEFVTLTMSSANHFSPLSFSPVGEMQITQVLSKTGGCRLLRFCQRPEDAGYSFYDNR